ncbi:PDZ domain-containing protein 6 [Phytophthora infestans]|uniref:PDZ domain-containing protein 6 n=1 Tax=Phytophthora infestans TaxID=4787 RepID=A0A833WJM4_PHYIN|nr:PDZ domain-containing protein 6 [Phytophthora infestans]
MASKSQQRQIQVLLTLHDGERSFGMSLAQKSPALGPKYTVVSSVFANSPADRAGVRKGYVLRSINDKPVGGLTVAQVANHFRNVGQARITLEVVESTASPRTSAFTAAATFGGATTLSNRPALQTEAGSNAQRTITPVTGFTAVSSGRAIAAPGSALAVPSLAPPKQPALRLVAKRAAKSLGLQPQSGVFSSTSASVASADAKTASGGNSKRKSVKPVLRLGPKPKSVASEKAEEKVTATASRVDLKPASQEQPTSDLPVTSRIPKSPVEAITSSRPQVNQAEQPESSPTPVPTPPKAKPAPASKTAAPTSEAKVPPASLVAATPRTAVPVSTGNTTVQPSSTLPTTAPTVLSHRAAAMTESNTQVATASSVKTANAPAGTTRSSMSAVALQPSTAPTQTVHPPEPAAVSAKRTHSSPAVIPPNPSVNSTPVRSPTRSTAAVQSTSSAPEVAQPKATTKTGKKRRRPHRKNAAPANGTTNTSNKGKSKAKKASKHHQEKTEMDTFLDDDEMLDLYAFSSDADAEQPPSPSAKAKRRTAKGRRRGGTDRPRHSLTVDRLVGMGFTQEDAEASVKEIGDDPDACMVWIISKIEERQFTADLNQASIQSEQSKRDEEKRVKKLEKEILSNAKKFMALFPTSYMACPESPSSNLKKLLQSTIDQVDGEAYIREIISKLLTLEGKSIRWYKEASRSYMLELAGRLDTVLETHDVITCCSRVSSSDVNSSNESCVFIRKVLEEVKALTTALFEMPTNQGGVPPVFLECDETTKFDLEDDGFEVIELDLER